MRNIFWVIGLVLGFGEGVFLMLFALDTWPDALGMAIHSIPGLLVICPAILGIWFRKTAGLILFLESLALSALWLTRMSHVSWPAYLMIPGGILLGGVFLFLGGLR